MSSDQSGLAVKLVRRDAESCVLTLAGELSLRSAGTVCGAVTKALLEVDRVLVDVSRLRLTWTPAVQVFPSILAVMGGWPWARLVLFGADPVLAASLSQLGVTSAVPLAADEPEARQLLERHPPQASRSWASAVIACLMRFWSVWWKGRLRSPLSGPDAVLDAGSTNSPATSATSTTGSAAASLTAVV